ncbi:uncharacterized protein [Antedon mediterranea]|uniref:uncharacterized protein isoform X2 n=1 Tax=Antedon mediterranea TaxID=105859 RepID=UPI003AF8FCF2
MRIKFLMTTKLVSEIASDVFTAPYSVPGGFCVAWRSCRMGISISFPVAPKEIYFTSPAAFMPTGQKREFAVNESTLEKTRFENITEKHFKNIIENRQEAMEAKAKFEDIRALANKYTQWTEADIFDFRLLFQEFDLNHDGLIDFEELVIALEDLGDTSSLETKRAYFNEIDIDGSNSIDFEEFIELINAVSSESASEHTALGNVCQKGNEIIHIIRGLDVFQQMDSGLF